MTNQRTRESMSSHSQLTYKASENACPRLMHYQREWKYRDGYQRSEIWPTLPKSESFQTLFQIMVGNHYFEPFSVIFLPPEGQNLASIAQNQVRSEHSPNKCTRQL